MLRFLTFLILLLTVTLTYSQGFPKSLYQDSVLIPYRYIISANQAYTQLKYYKSLEGLIQERLHQKDIVISYYEKAYNKYTEKDSLNRQLINNKSKQIESLKLSLKKANIKQQAQKIGIGVAIPASIAIGFITGRYLKK